MFALFNSTNYFLCILIDFYTPKVSHEPSSVEPEVRQEEVPAIESEQLESQFVDSTPRPSPELKSETPEEEDPHPLEFLQNFEEDLFEHYGNTSNYSY